MGNLTTTAKVKSVLGISVSTHDSLIDSFIASAEKEIADRCNRPSGFLTGTWTEHFDGEEQVDVWLTNVPVTSVASVKIVHSSSDSSTIDASNYTFDPASGRLWLYQSAVLAFELGGRSTFPPGLRNIQVVYVGGYADQAAVSSSAPNLERAAIELAVHMFGNALKGGQVAYQSMSLGNLSWTRRTDREVYDLVESLIYTYIRGVH